jgi:hypothetical protein
MSIDTYMKKEWFSHFKQNANLNKQLLKYDNNNSYVFSITYDDITNDNYKINISKNVKYEKYQCIKIKNKKYRIKIN